MKIAAQNRISIQRMNFMGRKYTSFTPVLDIYRMGLDGLSSLSPQDGAHRDNTELQSSHDQEESPPAGGCTDGVSTPATED
jgi:hypothetical protein